MAQTLELKSDALVTLGSYNPVNRVTITTVKDNDTIILGQYPNIIFEGGGDHFVPTSLLVDYGFIDNSINWNEAYTWGDHSTQGYLTDAPSDGSIYGRKDGIWEAVIGINPTGLEAIDEGSGIGWRLIGRNAANYGNIGLNAVDFSDSNSNSTTRGAVSNYSTVSGGQNNTANGLYAVVGGGYNNTTSGATSTIGGGGSNSASQTSTVSGGQSNTSSGTGATIGGGQSNIASGINAVVSGGNTNVSSGNYSSIVGGINNTTQGVNSSVIGGISSTSYSYGEITGGLFPTSYSGTTSSFVATDRIFNIGNGISTGSRSDAFTLLKSGLAIFPSLTTAMITAESTGRAALTREYFELKAIEAVIENIAVAGSFTVLPSHHGKTIELSGTTPTITFDPNTQAYPAHFSVYFHKLDATDATIAFTAAAGWTYREGGATAVASGSFTLAGEGGMCGVLRNGSDNLLKLLGNA